MKPVQCKMARAAVGLGVRELAKLSDMSVTTITRFEKGGDSRVSTVETLQQILEERGVMFINADADGGPGVRLKS